MNKFSCLLLAAGDSSRMRGENKLLLKVDGESLVKRTLKEITKTPLEETLVVTGFQPESLRLELQDLSPTLVQNDEYLTGMHTSIKAGVRALKKECHGFFICLSDQPYFDHRVLTKLSSEYEDGKIIIPVFSGERGHPVLISSDYINEIMEEPDGDYGCSYLLKRYPERIKTVEMNHHGILVDVDDPADYQRVLNNSYDVKDPVIDFYAKVSELKEQGKTFVIATVTEVIGSASARTGSKAIFSEEGTNILGWVGGGCAERFIGEESTAAIKEGKTRVVLADLDDEIFGLGVACGGKMKVFIDPHFPSETVYIPHSDKFVNEIRSLSSFYGWNVKKDFKGSAPETTEDLLITLANAVASQRKKTFEPLKIIKKVPATFGPIKLNKSVHKVTIVGRTRITEALARHFTLLNFQVKAIGPDLKQEDYPSTVRCSCLDDGYSDLDFSSDEMVIIASHTSQDPKIVENALKAGSPYVGMIGSYKRSEEVLTHLGLMNSYVKAPLSIPAGLDIDAKNPDEIALSVVTEILLLQRNAL